MDTPREPVKTDRHVATTHVDHVGHHESHETARSRWGGVDWGAILAAVFAGLGITMLLMAIGAAIGVTATDSEKNADTLGTALGIWALIATAIGTFAGSYIAGNMMRWNTRFTAIHHGITSWAFSIILSIWLGAAAATGLVGASLQAANAAAESNAVDTRDAENAAQNVQAPRVDVNQVLESGSWILVAGLLITLALAIAGWMLGAKKERVDDHVHA